MNVIGLRVLPIIYVQVWRTVKNTDAPQECVGRWRLGDAIDSHSDLAGNWILQSFFELHLSSAHF